MTCLQNRLQKVGWVVLYSLMSFITLFTAYQYVDDVERFVYPVVSDFKIVDAKREGNLVTLNGTMNKHRDCQTLELDAYTEKPGKFAELASLNIAQNNGSTKIITRVVGEQNWGPWFVTVPEGSSKLSFFVRHRCNPLYDVTTALTEVDIQ